MAPPDRNPVGDEQRTSEGALEPDAAARARIARGHNPTTSGAFPLSSLPIEVIQDISIGWAEFPLGLPSGALCRDLADSLADPALVAARAVQRFGTPANALRREVRRASAAGTGPSVAAALLSRVPATDPPARLRRALVEAARAGWLDLSLALLDRGVTDGFLAPALAAAAAGGHSALVDALLGHSPAELSCSAAFSAAARARRADVLAAILRWKRGSCLYLIIQEMDAAGARVVAEAIDGAPTVEGLVLNRNDLRDEGAAVLAGVLETNTRIVKLDIDDNHIGAEGAKTLAEALRFNTSRRILSLQYNNIGSAGATAIADALRGNETLERLFLASCNIRDTGALQFAEAMRSNRTLQLLSLRRNGIFDAGARALAGALRVGDTLRLWLEGNDISAAAGSHFEALGLSGRIDYVEDAQQE